MAENRIESKAHKPTAIPMADGKPLNPSEKGSKNRAYEPCMVKTKILENKELVFILTWNL